MKMDDEVISLDLTKPEDCRVYIQHAALDGNLCGRSITKVKMGGKWINLRKMTDQQAVAIATSMYLDIECEAQRQATGGNH